MKMVLMFVENGLHEKSYKQQCKASGEDLNKINKRVFDVSRNKVFVFDSRMSI